MKPVLRRTPAPVFRLGDLVVFAGREVVLDAVVHYPGGTRYAVLREVDDMLARTPWVPFRLLARADTKPAIQGRVLLRRAKPR